MANIGSFKKVNAELGDAERSVLFANELTSISGTPDGR